MKCFSGAFALTLTCGAMSTTAVLASGTGLSGLETDLTFRLEAPSSHGPEGEPGLFGIVRQASFATNAVTYQLGTAGNPGEIRFNISDRVGDALDNPLFCFNFAPGNSDAQLQLSVDSVGAQTAISGLGLDLAVQYVVSNGEIAVKPPASAQCFYRGVSGDFGLFGKAPAVEESGSPESGAGDRLFEDSFEAEMKLSISFSGWDSTATTGTKAYQLRITNDGQGDLGSVSFQEVFPTSLSVYPVRLSEGTWDCNGRGSGVGLVRVEGLAIAASETVVCDITRSLEGAGNLRLYAAAVAAPGATKLFDVAEISVTVE